MVRKGILLVILSFVMSGCLDEPDCYLLNNHIVGIAFKKLENSTADTVALRGIATAPGVVSGDTTDVSRLYLPLNYFEDETTYFITDLETTHLLTIGYISQAQFVSEKCGEKFVLSRLRVLGHTFDSVRLVSDVPTREGSAIQIEIFQ